MPPETIKLQGTLPYIVHHAMSGTNVCGVLPSLSVSLRKRRFQPWPFPALHRAHAFLNRPHHFRRHFFAPPAQLAAGAEDGDIGLLDVDQLLRAAPDDDSLASSIDRGDGITDPKRQTGQATLMSGSSGGRSGGKRTPVARPCRGDHSRKAATSNQAAQAPGVALETSTPDGGGAVSRGFARAMDAFEDSLRAASDAELISTTGSGPRPPQPKRANKAAAAASTSSASVSTKPKSPLYRPVARGLGVARRHSRGCQGAGGGGGGGGGRTTGSLSCLAVCARKPLLAAIARGGATSWSEAGGGCHSEPGEGGDEESISDSVTINAGVSQGSGQERQKPQQPATAGSSSPGASGASAEIQVWNYRTKRMLVRHRFGRDCSSQDDGGVGGGGENLVGSVIGAGGGFQGGGEDGAGGGDVDGNGGDATCPVALSLHPSGDSIAVAFPHCVSVFYVVGSGGDPVADQIGGGGVGGGVRAEGVGNTAVSKDTLSTSLQEPVLAEAAAAAESVPLATLRSDQREFLTKGMFSVAGEQEPIINCDPVSAVHYSPGGHLLAVVTGKVSCRLASLGVCALGRGWINDRAGCYCRPVRRSLPLSGCTEGWICRETLGERR